MVIKYVRSKYVLNTLCEVMYLVPMLACHLNNSKRHGSILTKQGLLVQ